MRGVQYRIDSGLFIYNAGLISTGRHRLDKDNRCAVGVSNTEDICIIGAEEDIDSRLCSSILESLFLNISQVIVQECSSGR